MNSAAAIATVQQTPVEELAKSLGFSTDLAFLAHAANARNVDEDTRTAQISTYLHSKQKGEVYEPYFVIPFRERAEALKKQRSDLPVEEETVEAAAQPPTVKKHRRRKQCKRFSVSRRKH